MSEEDAKYEDQLALYQIGLSQNPKIGSNAKVKLAWHFVAFDKDLVVSERNAKEMEWLKKKYVSKIQEIEKAKAFPVKPSRLCGWCEYLSVCAGGKDYLESKGKKFERPSGTPVAVSARLENKEAPSSPAHPPGSIVFGTPELKIGRKKLKPVSSTDQLSLF